MKHYNQDSNQAIARLLAMFIISDGKVDPREIEGLDKLGVYKVLGINHAQFAQILKDYCDDIFAEANPNNGSINLLKQERINSILEEITERNHRIIACALALDLCKSDGAINEPEMALLRYMMEAWNISIQDLETEFINK